MEALTQPASRSGVGFEENLQDLDDDSSCADTRLRYRGKIDYSRDCRESIGWFFGTRGSCQTAMTVFFAKVTRVIVFGSYLPRRRGQTK